MIPHADAAQKAVLFAPLAQTVVQVPQAPGSVAVLRQLPEQFVSPVPQEVTHDPAEHTVPAAQTVPQPPQFARSLCVLISQPLVALPSQLAQPVLQVPSAQAPTVHVALALA